MLSEDKEVMNIYRLFQEGQLHASKLLTREQRPAPRPEQRGSIL